MPDDDSMDPHDRLRAAIKQLAIARNDLNLRPEKDAKLAEAEINMRGVYDLLEADEWGDNFPDDVDPEDVL